MGSVLLGEEGWSALVLGEEGMETFLSNETRSKIEGLECLEDGKYGVGRVGVIISV